MEEVLQPVAKLRFIPEKITVVALSVSPWTGALPKTCNFTIRMALLTASKEKYLAYLPETTVLQLPATQKHGVETSE
jgi:hypothetical protein